MFVLPLQNPAQECFTAEIVPGHALILPQPFFNRGLGADASVVHSRQPHHFATLHPRKPRQDILDGIVENVTKGENTSYVWWRYNNRERRLRRFGVGTKCVRVEPALIPFWLNYFRIVSFRQLGHESSARFQDASR